MNNLGRLKQKMMIKPSVIQKQPVKILVGQETSSVPVIPQVSKTEVTFDEKPGFNRADIIKKLKRKTIDISAKKFDEEVREEQAIEMVPEVLVDESKEQKEKLEIAPETAKPRSKPKRKGKLIIIEENEDKVDDKDQELMQMVPKQPVRKTAKVEKGVALLGPELNVMIGDAPLNTRLPKREPPINIKTSSYYMNNREIFVNFINALFEPYKELIDSNKEDISCDNIGKTSSTFSLLTHQKIVRDYMNLYTPYRGLLLYHGLGSGKTATSIAIAEGMKSAKKIIIMTPASLRANYIEELKKAGDLLYKKNQYWEWISTNGDVNLINTISSVLNLPREFIRKHNGAWMVNASKPSNYDKLFDKEIQLLDEQIDLMIKEKYMFINYNGLRSKRLGELTNGYTTNLFDNSVVIVDEAHNLISRIVNKIKKEKPVPESDRGEKDHLPLSISTKLYEYLLSATNARVVLLSGTPVINYPNEFGILFNILRGYIKTWYLPLVIKTSSKIDKDVLKNMIVGEKSHDYVDYSPSSKVLTITRNPFGFKDKVKKTGEYKGVSNDGNENPDYISDSEFERKIISILYKNDIEVPSQGIKIRNFKALPDNIDQFYNTYIDPVTQKLKNEDSLKRRILGLSSYFKSAQENLLPTYDKQLGKDYHIVRIPMSDYQFKIYESARIKERKNEKPKSKKVDAKGNIEEPSSTYRIFSRLFCNYVFPNRPFPLDILFKQMIESLGNNKLKEQIYAKIVENANLNKEKILNKIDDPNEKEQLSIQIDTLLKENINEQVEIIYKEAMKMKEDVPKSKTKKNVSKKNKKQNNPVVIDKNELFVISETDKSAIDQLADTMNIITDEASEGTDNTDTLLKNAQRLESKKDMDADNEGEVEGDEILDEIGGETYKEMVKDSLRYLWEHSNEYLTKDALTTYGPKFLHMLENITDPEYVGLHLVYSQFRTLEGIGIFALVLKKNGFAEFKIAKNSAGVWEINIDEADLGKPTFALYTGTETVEEKEMIRHIYNGEWNLVPDSIANKLNVMANNNNLGEIIKVLMITSSGSEGINLRNTRYVHIMEPYWHPVRLEQVIGRARRICSHKDLPKELQTVEVFIYLMEFTAAQLKSDEAVELKRKDLSRNLPKVPLTSDQNLFEISEIKANLTQQLTDAIKQSSFDCNFYANGNCVNFADPTPNKFSYVPDFSAQPNDTTVKANKEKVQWKGKPITIKGIEYVYRRISNNELYIYDKASYEEALKNSSVNPLQIGVIEINDKGQQIFKYI